MSKNVSAIASYISRRIEEVSTYEDIPVHDAWPRVSAEMLGYSTESLDFFANRDSGIDYCYRNERTFEVFQCKMHYLDEVGEVDLKSPFGPEGIEDLRNAADFLLRKVNPANIDPRLVSFREQLAEELSLCVSVDEEIDNAPRVSLALRLITLGDALSPEAKAYERALRTHLRGLQAEHPALAISLEHVGLSQLAEFFESPDSPPRSAQPIKLRLAYAALKFKEPREAEISTNQFITFYTPATDLVSAARKEGVALFDANVRYELASSNINQQIRQSASHTKTMKQFHLYNNGVTVTATGWSYLENRKRLEIRDPAVINGCQTVRSLARVQQELEQSEPGDEHRLRSFQDTCLVLVRLINREVVDAEEIVKAANTQNAMEPRNLLGNQTEQRALEREFAEFGWFYERKDGSLDALKEAKRSYFGTPLSKFAVTRKGPGRRAYRSCDNREVARRWLSFIGYSDEGKNKRRQHFPEDGKGLYEKIFRQTPETHRDVFLLDKKKSGTTPRMEEGRAPAVWMLYAFQLHALIQHLLPVATRVRSRVRREIQEAGRNPTIDAINERIFGDDDHRLAFALSMLDHVTLELAGLAIALALKDRWLAPAPGLSALKRGSVGILCDQSEVPAALQPEGVSGLTHDDVERDPSLIAIRLAVQAIEATLQRPEILASFRGSERKSRYLESDSVIRAYAEMLVQYDDYLSKPGAFVGWWKGGSPIGQIRALLLSGDKK